AETAPEPKKEGPLGPSFASDIAEEPSACEASGNLDADHLYWRDGTILSVCLGVVDRVDDIHAAGDLTKDGMLGRASGEVVQEIVVAGVDEELAAPRLWARVCHRERADLVGESNIRRVLVGDGPVRRLTGAAARTVGIFAVRAAELVHKVRDDPMKVEAVVEAFLNEAYEVAAGNGHLVDEDLRLKITHACFKFCDRIAHGSRAYL